MQEKLKNKSGVIVFILFLLTIFVSPLFAAEYSRTYKFEEPKIITLPNNRQILDMEGTWPKDDIVGAPILPAKTSKMFIPAEEKVVSIEIGYGALRTIEGSYVIQHATTPYPLSHKGPIIVEEPAPDIYGTNAVYPSTVYRARGPQFLRGIQIVLVDLMPVLYNPVEGQLQYYEELEVRINTEKQKRPAGVMPFRNSPQDREKILRTIENKEDFLRLYPNPGQGKPAGSSSMAEEPSPTETRQYVVITTAVLMNAAQVITDHRKSPAGGEYTTYIEDIDNINNNYTDPDDPDADLAKKMRNFIRYMYTNYGTKYVLLLGDCDGRPGTHAIPTRGCYAEVGIYKDSNIPSDLYFGCLDGPWDGDGDGNWGESGDGIDGYDIDWESEVYVGRIAADNETEAMNQINKIIDFETAPHPNKALLVGEQLDDCPTWGGDRMDWVYNEGMCDGGICPMPNTNLYDKEGVWGKSQLLTLINSNEYHWLNHLGHANVTYSMRLYNSDIASMTNSKYLFVYTQGCYSGSIDNRQSSGSYLYTVDCFGENMTNGYSDGGAFAYIGNSRYGWYNSCGSVAGASNLAHKKFVDAIFKDNITKVGEANQESKLDLDQNQGLYRWIAFETNLLGCPATDLNPAPADCSSSADCDDGLFCNGQETCEGGTCQPGTDPCDDGVGCTIDICNDNTDSCEHNPMDGLCDDGFFCTGVETCDPVLDCQSGTLIDCDDGVGCTIDICNDNTDSCEHNPMNGLCDDGFFCTGAETCDPVLDCQPGLDPCPGPGQGCDEATSQCVELDCSDCFKGMCDGVCHPVKDGPNCPDCVCISTEDIEVTCADGIDNDCDGGVDCADSDCDGNPACACVPTELDGEVTCADGIDNDCDELTDCADLDCAGDPACNQQCLPAGADCTVNTTGCCEGLNCVAVGKKGKMVCK